MLTAAIGNKATLPRFKQTTELSIWPQSGAQEGQLNGVRERF